MSHNYNKHARDKYIVGSLFVGAMIIALYFVFTANLGAPTTTNPLASTTVDFATTTASSTPVDLNDPKVVLAKCLTAKGVKMYGTYWCENCLAQKKDFGPAFQFISYVECTEDTQACLAKSVDGYPTWIRADGDKLLGHRPLKDLATWAGCVFEVTR